MKQKGIILVLIAAVFWAFMGITSRNLGSLSINSFTIAFFRAIIAGLCMFLILWKKKRSELKIGLKDTLFFMIYGFVAFTVAFTGYNISVTRIPISVATILFFLNPIWVVLLNKILFKEKIGIKKMIIMPIVLVGCMLIAKIDNLQELNMDKFGLMAGLVAGLAFAMQIIIPRLYKGKCSRDTMVMYGYLFGSAALFLLADFSFVSQVKGDSSVLGYMIINILVIGVFNTFIPNTAYIKSTEYIDTSLASLMVALEPIMSSIFAYFVYHESLSFMQICGMFIVIFGVIFLELDINKLTSKLRCSSN